MEVSSYNLNWKNKLSKFIFYPNFFTCFKHCQHQFQRFLLKLWTNWFLDFCGMVKLPESSSKPCRPTERGGLSLPDFQLYYLAAQSRAIWVWIKDLKHPPAWKHFEQSHTAEVLSSSPFIHSYHKQNNFTSNPITKFTSKIWDEIRAKFHNIRTLYSSTPS